MPIWKEIVKGVPAINREVEEEKITSNEGLARIGDLLEKSETYKGADERCQKGEDGPWDPEIVSLVTELQMLRDDPSAVTEDTYNVFLDEIYDWADYARVWINPHVKTTPMPDDDAVRDAIALSKIPKKRTAQR